MESNISKQQIVTIQDTAKDRINNSPISNQKGFIPLILGVVILLIVVAGGAYYLGTHQNQSSQQNISINQPSPTPSSFYSRLTPLETNENWSRYIITNFLFGKYSIEILKNWYAWSVPQDAQGVIYITDTGNFENYYYIKRIKPQGHHFFLITWAQDHRGPIMDDFKNDYVTTPTTIGGLSGIRAVKKNGDFGEEIVVALRRSSQPNDYLYFKYQFGDKTIFNHLLSTFKLTY